MKRLQYIFLFYLFLLLGTTSYAQADGISVKSLKNVSDVKPYATQTNTPKDNSGIPAAILLVHTQDDVELDFYANYQIGEAKKIGKDYWIYMAEGAKNIEISHPRFEKIKVVFNDASYGSIPYLKSKYTYELDIHVPQTNVVVVHDTVVLGANKSNRQFYKIRVEPSDAIVEVEVDGDWQLWTTENGIASDILSYGSYRYRISAPEYHTEEAILTLDDNHNELIVNLQPNFGYLTIDGTTNANGALVYVTNTFTRFTQRLGSIPLTPQKLTSGPYMIKLQKDKYKTSSFMIRIKDGDTLTLSPVLQENSTFITLETKPYASILMDGIELGKGNWTGEVEYGEHEVETRAPNHHSAFTLLNITSSDAQRTLSLNDPLPIVGSMILKGTPTDAKVYIDNQYMGTTPVILDQLLIGTHQLRVEKDGYSPYHQSITVYEGSEQSHRYTLVQTNSPASTPAYSSNHSTTSPTRTMTTPASSRTTSIPTGTTTTPSRATTPTTTTTPAESVEEPSSKTFTVKGVSFAMVYVDGGTFTMGATPEQEEDADRDEKPPHTVSLSSYLIGETEVTQALWEAVMGKNPSTFVDPKNPVENVSWKDCQAFIKKLNKLTGEVFRLPTEAEWEYAARGGQKTRNYKYAGSNNLDEVAWYTENSHGRTYLVKQKKANELGLYDMSGNVWEWCQDWYSSYDSTNKINPKGPSEGSNNVVRGGSWYFNVWRCRVASRYQWQPTQSINYIGLRLAMSKKFTSATNK